MQSLKKSASSILCLLALLALTNAEKRRVLKSDKTRKPSKCEHSYYVSVEEYTNDPPIFQAPPNLNPDATPICDSTGICTGFTVIQQDVPIYSDKELTTRVGFWNSHGVFVSGLRQFTNGVLNFNDGSEVVYAGEYLCQNEGGINEVSSCGRIGLTSG